MPPAPVKRIAVLTSGGDCAGLNAALRAITLHAEHLGWEVIGIMNGTHGLIDRPPRIMPLTTVMMNNAVLRQGGTILGTTNKGNPFAYPMTDGSFKDLSADIVAGFRALNCDALIGIGGDGSMDILTRLAAQGDIPLIGIPKTIDNDLGITEMSIGFATAVDVATEALDRLQPTAASHDRIMILEVMGGDAGHIALTAGIAGGADVILIPEIPYSINAIAAHIKKIRSLGRNFALAVVSEAVQSPDRENINKIYADGQKRLGGIGQVIGDLIAEACQAETRVTVLGHVQRGGQPGAHDRLLASAFGVHAVMLAQQEKFGRMVAWKNRCVTDVPILDAIRACQTVDIDGDLIKTARGLGIYVGEH